MINTQKKLYKAIEGLYPTGFLGFDPKKKSPTNYTEYKDSLLEGFTPHTEKELEDALVVEELRITNDKENKLIKKESSDIIKDKIRNDETVTNQELLEVIKTLI